LQFAGVGNIAFGARSTSSVSAFSTAGILGRRIRTIRTWEAPLSPGDGLVLHTDGISPRFALGDLPWSTPSAAIADLILRSGGKRGDDATCVVVRCLALDARRRNGS
jgi:hypothetical protein